MTVIIKVGWLKADWSGLDSSVKATHLESALVRVFTTAALLKLVGSAGSASMNAAIYPWLHSEHVSCPSQDSAEATYRLRALLTRWF
jgi:hypothetical protein